MRMIGNMITIMKDKLREIPFTKTHKLIPVYYNMLSYLKMSATLEFQIAMYQQFFKIEEEKNVSESLY